MVRREGPGLGRRLDADGTGHVGAGPAGAGRTGTASLGTGPIGVPYDVHDDDPAPDHDIRALLRITPFRRLFFALGLSSFGDWLGLLATAALAKNLASGSYTAENFAIAGVFILRLAPAVVLGPFAGVVADRLDRRWTLVYGDVLRFLLFASIVLVGTLWWLYIATILVECVALFWGPANEATVPNLVPRRRLEAANQIGLVATYGSAPIAAVTYSGLGLVASGADAVAGVGTFDPIAVALWIDALTFLVSALVIWRLDFPKGTGREAARQVGVVRSILDGWRFVAATPVVRGLVLGMLGAFAAGGFVIGLAQTFVDDLGAGQPGFGVLFGAVFVGLAVGMWSGPRLLGDFSRRRLFGLALTCAGFFLVLLALVPNLVLAVFATVAVGACGGVSWVTGYTLLGLEVDDEVRGRTFGFLQSAARVVLVLVLAAGPALAAPIGKHSIHLPSNVTLTYNGAAWVFLFAGVLAAVMGITAYRQMDDRPGSSLRRDLVEAWIARRELPLAALPRQTTGWFIAFEGGDGTGKSTQARLLADWLRDEQGHDVVLTREPGATPVGVRLREVLLGDGEGVGPRAEALLFAADRAHHVDSLIRPALARGAIVVTDRFVDSSIAYQGAGRALDADEIAYISRWATGGLVPDLTVLLDVPQEISRVRRANDPQRNGADRLESLPEEFHERVRQGFLELARREPHRYLVLDGSDARDDLQAAIRRRVRDIVPISRKRRAELAARLAAEEEARRRRASAEAEVLRLDAELRGRTRDEARARQEARRRAREEAERQLQEEAERQLREEERQRQEDRSAEVAALEAAALEAEAAADATVPDVTVPDVTRPDATLPEVTVPDVRVPVAKAPDTRAPDAKAPETTLPDAAVLSATARVPVVEPKPEPRPEPVAKPVVVPVADVVEPTVVEPAAAKPVAAEPVAAAPVVEPVVVEPVVDETAPAEPPRLGRRGRGQGGHALSVPRRSWFSSEPAQPDPAPTASPEPAARVEPTAPPAAVPTEPVTPPDGQPVVAEDAPEWLQDTTQIPVVEDEVVQESDTPTSQLDLSEEIFGPHWRQR